MKKFIVAGCTAAILLGGYACTKSTDLSPDEASASSARAGAVQSGTATGPHSGTGRPGKPFSGTGGPGTPRGPHSGTATQPISGTGGPGGHPHGHGPNH